MLRLDRYEWRLLNKGKEVMLGQYPTGWVRRLASWGWAVCNVNIVCLSIEPGVDGEPELAVSTTAAAAAEEAANTSFFYNTPFPACTLLIQNETHTHTHTHTHIVQGYSIGSRRSSSSSRSC
jgi:hypothetical protein